MNFSGSIGAHFTFPKKPWFLYLWIKTHFLSLLLLGLRFPQYLLPERSILHKSLMLIFLKYPILSDLLARHHFSLTSLSKFLIQANLILAIFNGLFFFFTEKQTSQEVFRVFLRLTIWIILTWHFLNYNSFKFLCWVMSHTLHSSKCDHLLR